MAGTLEGSSEKSIDISFKIIQEIEDFSEAFDISENLDVDLGGLEELEEMKERLMMEFQKCQPGFINYKEKVGKMKICGRLFTMQCLLWHV